MELKEVFEPVLNFIKNFQKKDKEIASKQAAKDRLKLVLMQDRASVSPDFFEMMKKEIIDVIKKYIEIDEESLEVELTRGVEVGLEGPALYANIPIKNVKPVAPKSKEEEEQEEKEAVKMTEKEAEEVAEKILNHAEELLNKAKNEDETTKEAGLLKENEEEKNEEKIEEVKQPKKEESKTKTKSTAKKTVKKTSTKPKKETKKSENH